jgi:hypothetical protein
MGFLSFLEWMLSARLALNDGGYFRASMALPVEPVERPGSLGLDSGQVNELAMLKSTANLALPDRGPRFNIVNHLQPPFVGKLY